MRKSILVLLLILSFGLAIRVYRVTSLPLYGDELTMVYDTYSILKTGMDQTGSRLPLTFKMGAGRPGGYIYFSLPFVSVFGPTAWGLRCLSLLSGLGVTVLSYFLGKKLLGERIGLLACILTAVSPWDIYLSRGGFEAHFALFLALLGIVSFLYAKNKSWLYLIWALAWGLAIHTYPTFKLTLPLVFLFLIWYGGELKKILANEAPAAYAAGIFSYASSEQNPPKRKSNSRSSTSLHSRFSAKADKLFLAAILVIAVFAGLAARETFFANSEGRFLSINIFSDKNLRESIIQRVNNERNISSLPASFKPVFINRQIEYSRILLENYIKNLSPNFLYLRGDGNPRHNPGEFGMLYLVELPLLFVALINMWSDRKKEMLFLIGWILIVPLATMFLDEAHGLRNALMLPPFILLSAYAFTKISRSFQSLVPVLILLQLIYILVRVYYIAPAKFASFWSYPAQKASEEALAKKDSYKFVYLSSSIDNIEYAYPVYAKLDPKLVISQYNKYPKVYGNVVITDLKGGDSGNIGKDSLVISE